ncbi:hypothetical protein [Chitinophaga sp. Cy-1792]|uniref:hypothetical protein n=1 Tax=Chitinophaga sp. Cy-1792 TaxID=2608339 RepID=UPI00141F060E|nr:hypothetical protein [Chitinophaga sp. Cy-1792]NIG54075.1 hypothetical protein [Chitinophaga sp. Cy-1792]
MKHNELSEYTFEPISYFREIPGTPGKFIGQTTKQSLLRLSLTNNIIQLEHSVNIPSLQRNFCFGQDNNIIIPTGEDKLLVVHPETLEFLPEIQLEKGLRPDQLAYLPGRKIYISGCDRKMLYILDADFKLLKKITPDNGSFYPIINEAENLLAFYSYNQFTFYDLYILTDQLDIISKKGYTDRVLCRPPITYSEYFNEYEDLCLEPSEDFAFNGNNFAVSYRSSVEYYNPAVSNHTPLWKLDISPYPVKWDRGPKYFNGNIPIAFINTNILVVCKKKMLLFFDISEQIIVHIEKLFVEEEVSKLFMDKNSDHLLVFAGATIKPINVKKWQE